MGRGEKEEERLPAGSYLFCHLSNRLDAGSIQMAVVLAGLNEFVRLNVLLHFVPGRHKVVIPAIYLILSLGPCRICQEVTPTPQRSNHHPSSSKAACISPQSAQWVLQWKGLLGKPRLRGSEPPSQHPLGPPSLWPQMVTTEHENGSEAPLL